jgi:predicted DNA-binding transcriptional regulator AlpA
MTIERLKEKLRLHAARGFYSQDTAAARLGISSSMLKKLVDQGQAPPFHVISTRRIWAREDLDAWIQARRVDPQPGPPVRIRDRSAA